MSYTVETVPSTRAPFAADIVLPFSDKVIHERVMVYPATTRETLCRGVPILEDVVFVTADGVIDRAQTSWVRPRSR